MNRLFFPAIALSNRLKFSGKFVLLACLFALQIGYVCWQALHQSIKQQQYVDHELAGVEHLLQFMPLFEALQQHRGLSFRRDNGESGLKEPLAAKAAQIQASLQALDTDERDADWQRLPQGWQSLKTGTETGEALFEQHNQLLQRLIDELSDVASLSGLQLDPEARTFYPITTLIKGLPEYLETLGQLRGYSAGLAQGEFAPNTYMQLTVLDKRMLLAIDRLDKEFQRIFTENPAARVRLDAGLQRLQQASKQLHESIKQEMLDADAIRLKSEQLFQQATAILNQGFELYRQLADQLKQDLQQRQARERLQGYLTFAATSLIGLLLCYFLYGVYLGIQHSIRQLNQAADRAANGDLVCNLSLSGQDELTHIADRFNRMLTGIRALLREARQTSDDVQDTSKDLTRIAEQSESYLQEQQLESTQVATAITEMASTVNEVASNAEQAARAADDANHQAQQGQQVVKDSIHRIEQLAQQLDSASEVISQLEQDSEAIGSVLDVIKGIADQTNLLALNAAIEAARAGEQGRGFAVVADEVRTLASRTQKSTQEIREMIERLQQGAARSVSAMAQGRSQAHQGVEKSVQAGQALEGITRSVLRIVDMNNQIASAAEQQSVVAEQINQNIVKITQSTSRTLASGRQVTQASNALGQQASALLDNVNRFKLD